MDTLSSIVEILSENSAEKVIPKTVQGFSKISAQIEILFETLKNETEEEFTEKGIKQMKKGLLCDFSFFLENLKDKEL